MSSSQNNDSDDRFALGLIFALVVLSSLAMLGFGIYTGMKGAKSANKGAVTAAVVQTGAPAVVVVETAVVAVPAAVVAVDEDAARVIIDNGVVKFYFATAKSELAVGANEALVDVIAGIKAGQRATISGFTDTTGDPEKNAELAKLRAMAVRDALVAQGVTEDKLDLKKPEAIEIAGSGAEARRVEVVLVK